MLAVPGGLGSERAALRDGAAPPPNLLSQNFPNPLPAAGQESTCIWFDLAETGSVELEILDLRGGRVRRFIPGPDLGEALGAGGHRRGGPRGRPRRPPPPVGRPGRPGRRGAARGRPGQEYAPPR